MVFRNGQLKFDSVLGKKRTAEEVSIPLEP